MTSCDLELLGDGLVRVRWRSLVSFPPGATHVAFRLSADHVRDVRCEGSGVRPTVVRLGRRTAVLLKLHGEIPPRPGTARRSQVELIYTCRASLQRWTPDTSVWYLTRKALPRLFFGRSHRSPKWLAQSEVARESETKTATEVGLRWDQGTVRVFGPVPDPATGSADLVLSEAELADFEIYFGAFHLVAHGEGFALWVPGSNAPSSLQSSYRRVLRSAAQVRQYLVEIFGNPRVTAVHIVLAPRLAVPAQFVGGTLLIRDPRDASGELTVSGETDLLAQLAHELSHSWWVPVAIDQNDRRVWGLIEGIAVASEFLALMHFLPDGEQKQVMPRKKAHHCDLLTRRFGDLLRHYQSREASAGLRFGYVLIALIVSQDHPTLRALQRLFQSFNANVSGRDALAVRMAAAFGKELTSVLMEILDRPRPPIASVRVKRGEEEGGEVWFRFATVEDAEGFLRLLDGSRAFADKRRDVARTGAAIRLTLEPRASADWLQYLTPGFVVDRRVVQWNRIGTSRVLRRLSEVAWGLQARPRHDSILARFQCAFVGLAEMIVESESALGYELVANALEGWMTPVARRLRQAASWRAPW